MKFYAKKKVPLDITDYGSFINYISESISSMESKRAAEVEKNKQDAIVRKENARVAKQLFYENLKSLSSELRDKLTDKWLGNKQAKYILHIGPTCSGKTFNAIKRLSECKNGAYLAPLRLLAWEIADKMNSNNVQCTLLTGEECVLVDNAVVVSSTIELANYDVNHDIVVI